MSTDKRAILHFAGFSSPSRGNFIRSLETLRARIESDGRQMLYLFPAATRQREWAGQLAEEAEVFFLTDNPVKNLFLIRRLIKRFRVGIIHLHFYTLADLMIFSLAAPTKRIRKLVHLHSELFVHSGIIGLLERVLVSGKEFIGVSQTTADQAKKLFPKNKTHCVKNAICFERFDSPPQGNGCLGVLDPNKKTLLMFGYNYLVKGVDLAIKAVSRLNEKGADLQLAVVVTSLEKATAQTKELFGSVPQGVYFLPACDNVLSYYKVCDIFLAPSRKEGFSYAAVEVASLEIPIVLSDISAHRELVLPHGFYFESQSPESLAQQIEAAVQNAGAMREQLSRQAQEVREIYRIDEWAEKLYNIYNET